MFLRTLLKEENLMTTVATVAMGASTFTYTLNVLAAHRHAKHCYKRGPDYKIVRPNEVLKIRFDDILTNLGFTEWNKTFFHLFVCNGEDVKRIGMTKSRNGLFIGYPEYFQCASDESIIRTGIYAGVKWDSEDGKSLLNSLHLSENAQSFILAKETVLADNYYQVLRAVLVPVFTVVYYGIGLKLHEWLKLLDKPIATSLCIHGVAVFLTFILYLFVKDAMYVKYDYAAHERVYALGVTYMQGAIEYYSKKIQRNKALRNLTDNGKWWYRENGEEINIFTFFLAKGLPLAALLSVAEDTLEKEYDMQKFTEIPTPRSDPYPIY